MCVYLELMPALSPFILEVRTSSSGFTPLLPIIILGQRMIFSQRTIFSQRAIFSQRTIFSQLTNYLDDKTKSLHLPTQKLLLYYNERQIYSFLRFGSFRCTQLYSCTQQMVRIGEISLPQRSKIELFDTWKLENWKVFPTQISEMGTNEILSTMSVNTRPKDEPGYS